MVKEAGFALWEIVGITNAFIGTVLIESISSQVVTSAVGPYLLVAIELFTVNLVLIFTSYNFQRQKFKTLRICNREIPMLDITFLISFLTFILLTVAKLRS